MKGASHQHVSSSHQDQRNITWNLHVFKRLLTRFMHLAFKPLCQVSRDVPHSLSITYLKARIHSHGNVRRSQGVTAKHQRMACQFTSNRLWAEDNVFSLRCLR